MIFSFFATRRELKRLVKDRDFWRDKAERLEKKVEEKNSIILERDFAWSDRFLTNKVNTFAIRDEVASRIADKAETVIPYDAESDKKAFLQARYAEVLQDAKDADLSEADADQRYKELEPQFLEAFQETF